MTRASLLFSLTLLAACNPDPKDDGTDGSNDGADGADGTDGGEGTDADGDGFTADEDCDDDDADVNPSASEVCDGVDNDCDGDIDDADSGLDTSTASTWYADADTDSYGDAGASSVACDQPSGYVADDQDCDDYDAAINPDATEVCDGEDNDCNGDIDDDDAGLDPSTASTWYADTDTDSYGDASASVVACDQPSGYVADDTDCDDTEGTANPGGTEVPGDGVDNDCDPSTRDLVGGTFDTSAATLTIRGEASFEGFGNQIVAGDFNGDGDPDVLSGSGSIGTAYGFFGPLTASTTVASADATLTGLSSGSVSYLTMAAADFDGDGIDDLWATAPFSTNGAAYLVHGPFTGTAAVSSIADATITGEAASDYLGRRIAIDGDVTGDGLLDMIVSASRNDNGGLNAGAVYVFSGDQSGSTSASTADAIIEGTGTNHTVGWDVGSGDFNGDGLGDVLLSSEVVTSYEGSVWAHFGPVTGSTTTAAADATMRGAGTGTYFGWDVLGLGDLNGDGYDEVGVAAPFDNVSTSTAGSLYIWDGSATFSGEYAASTADALVTGGSAGDYLGIDVVALNDYDGDGNDDLMVAAPYDDVVRRYAGSAYLFLGPLSGTVGASDAFVELNGTIGAGYFGSAMAPTGGDLDGDGLEDLWISAPGASVTQSTQGALYLFGSASL